MFQASTQPEILRNRHCGHTYEKTTILNLMRSDARLR